jgi:hypothetical protein
VFTREQIAVRRHFRIEIGSANHTGLGPVSTEGGYHDACVADSNKPNRLKNVLPKKRSAYARKPNYFHLALYERRFCARPDKPKPAHT